MSLDSIINPDGAHALTPEFIAAKEELRRLRAIESAVRDMRQHQAAYFKTRSPDELQASKKAEREVDRMLAELEPKAQGRLF